MSTIDPIEAQREATAAIRGYVYQFDASILTILNASGDTEVTVEGVEDFDIRSTDSDTHGQVKYYEAQKLTDATLRDAILPMIEGFLRCSPDDRKRKHYVLYGHFKEAPDDTPVYGLADLQRVLVHRPFKTDTETKARVRIEVNLQEKIGASNSELADFCGRFTVRLSEAFDAHRARVIDGLCNALSVSKTEAERYSYPSSLTAMVALSTAATRPARTTTRRDFLQKIRPDVALYSAWAMREEGESAYCKTLRELHFGNFNIDSRDRFFVVRLPDSDGIDELHGLVQHIITKWSSHKVNRKPDRERYAPFFYFPGLPETVLTKLKGRLVSDGHKITDGYAYHGADFSTEHLLLPQTRDYPVSARIVADKPQFDAALSATKRSRLVVQLHLGDPCAVDPAVQQIAIPIKSASMARKIV